MFGLRMFASMLFVDGAVLFVLYGVIEVFGAARAGLVAFLPALLMVGVGLLVRPRARVSSAPVVERSMQPTTRPYR